MTHEEKRRQAVKVAMYDAAVQGVLEAAKQAVRDDLEAEETGMIEHEEFVSRVSSYTAEAKEFLGKRPPHPPPPTKLAFSAERGGQ